MNINVNPTTKIGILIKDNTSSKNGQKFYTLTSTTSKKSLSFPYSSMVNQNFLEQAVGFLGSCGIRVASIISNDHGSYTMVIAMNYYDKVHRLFSFAK